MKYTKYIITLALLLAPVRSQNEVDPPATPEEPAPVAPEEPAPAASEEPAPTTPEEPQE